MAKRYPYAVFDGNQSPDQELFAESCHETLTAANRAAAKLNSRDPNAHYYVIEWEATRWARLGAAPEHYPLGYMQGRGAS